MEIKSEVGGELGTESGWRTVWKSAEKKQVGGPMGEKARAERDGHLTGLGFEDGGAGALAVEAEEAHGGRLTDRRGYNSIVVDFISSDSVTVRSPVLVEWWNPKAA